MCDDTWSVVPEMACGSEKTFVDFLLQDGTQVVEEIGEDVLERFGKNNVEALLKNDGSRTKKNNQSVHEGFRIEDHSSGRQQGFENSKESRESSRRKVSGYSSKVCKECGSHVAVYVKDVDLPESTRNKGDDGVKHHLSTNAAEKGKLGQLSDDIIQDYFGVKENTVSQSSKPNVIDPSDISITISSEGNTEAMPERMKTKPVDDVLNRTQSESHEGKNQKLNSNSSQPSSVPHETQSGNNEAAGETSWREYLWFGSAKPKSSTKPPDQNSKPSTTSSARDSAVRDPDIKTLGEALRHFGLYSSLQKFERSLDALRKRQITEEQHEFYLKRFDKDIQKLSFKYHPDRVKNRGGSDEEMAVAQKMQTALNATRTVLNVLNETFMEDINTDHRFGFYTRLKISSLGNEEEIKSHVYEVLYKISYLSEIKRQNIIAEIRNFLEEGRGCMKWYLLDKEEEFEKCRNLAMFHLKKCIKGYKKLKEEFRAVEEECRGDKLDNIVTSLQKMADKSSSIMDTLRDLRKFAKKIPNGKCQFYSPTESIDAYFELPFVCYVNAMIMCDSVFKNRNPTFWSKYRHSNRTEYFDYSGTIILNYPYYLASFYSGSSMYGDVIEKTMGEKSGDRQAIEDEFRKALRQVNEYLEDTFKIEHYRIESSRANHLLEEYSKCMQMVTEFKKKEKELKQDIEKLAHRNQEIEDKYDRAMRESEEQSNRVKNRLQRSKLLREQGAASLAKKQ